MGTMKVEGKKNLVVHAFLLFLTLYVTSLVALLVVPAQDRATKFYFSLAAILLLEVLGFGFPVLLAFRTLRAKGVFKISLETTVFMSVYSVGVMILVLLAFGPVSLSTVVALQLGWLIFFMLSLCANAMGLIANMSRRKRSPLRDFQKQFSSLCQRLARVETAEADGLKTSFAAFRDELQYAAEESGSDREPANSELPACLARMKSELAALEAAANPRNIVPAAIPVSEAVKSLDWELRHVRQAFRRGPVLVA
jgi:ABC-type tungstate transport system substrate-binding protein